MSAAFIVKEYAVTVKIVPLAIIAFSLGLHAQEQQVVKFNPFAGSGVTTAWKDGSRSVVSTAGMALIVRLSPKVFVRPVAGVGAIVPLKTLDSFRVVQAGALVGYRIAKRFSVLAGGGETMQFPRTGALYLPTALFSSATRIHGCFGVYTPVTLNGKGYGVSVQAGCIW
jgi:hypothetical protein